MTAPSLLIAGAGIGGLTAALALARRGFAVTLAEKRTGFAETGAGLQVSPNAGRVLESLGLKLAMKRDACLAGRLTVRRWSSGAEIAAMPFGEDGGTPFRLFHRVDLHTLLLDAARATPGLRLVVGKGLDGLAEQDGKMLATLRSASGQAETLGVDAVIGADGLWSATRALSGDGVAPRFTGFEAWRTLIPCGSGAARGEVTLLLGKAHHAVTYPVAGGRQTNLVIVRRAETTREGWSREGDPAVIARELREAAPILRDLAASAPGWQVWSLFDRGTAAMARGRVALLGDAAHPVLPFLAQGAALAIEDAGCLATGLAAAVQRGGTAALPAALSAYAARRAPRAARIQAESRANARSYHFGAPLALARDLVMRRLGPEGMRRRYDWIYGWRE